jgi:hypothetical protein
MRFGWAGAAPSRTRVAVRMTTALVAAVGVSWGALWLGALLERSRLLPLRTRYLRGR